MKFNIDVRISFVLNSEMLSTWDISEELKRIFELAENREPTHETSPKKTALDALANFKAGQSDKNSSALQAALNAYPFDSLYFPHASSHPEKTMQPIGQYLNARMAQHYQELFFSEIALGKSMQKLLKIIEAVPNTYPESSNVVTALSEELNSIIEATHKTVKHRYQALNDHHEGSSGLTPDYTDFLNYRATPFYADSDSMRQILPGYLASFKHDFLRQKDSFIDTLSYLTLMNVSFFHCAIRCGYAEHLKISAPEKSEREAMYDKARVCIDLVHQFEETAQSLLRHVSDLSNTLGLGQQSTHDNPFKRAPR